MGLDNRLAYPQADPHPRFLGGDEWLEQLTGDFRGKARPLSRTVMVAPASWAVRTMFSPGPGGAGHCVQRAADQIYQHLLNPAPG